MDRGVCLGLSAVEGMPILATIISRLEVDEVLFAYIVVASHAVSLVLVRVNNGI